jgi:hypothetical protein
MLAAFDVELNNNGHDANIRKSIRLAEGFALPKNSPLKGPLSEHIKKLKESGIFFRVVTTHMGPRASQIIRAAK